MIKLLNDEKCIIESISFNYGDVNLYDTCEPYCEPNCNPTCNPVCSPSCNPCYPGSHCNPETFYCAPDRD